MSSRAPPPANRLLLPEPLLPLKHLPYLIKYGTIFNYLCSPFVHLPGDDFPEEELLPVVWEGWLESWYQLFDKRIWWILEQDDGADRQAYFVRKSMLRQTLEKTPVDQQRVDKLQRSMERPLRRLARRLEQIFGALPLAVSLPAH
jgi:hypothetical protein